MILVTGGAGFIGSNFVLDWVASSDEPLVNLDALTYAGNLENLSALDGHPGHAFVRGDICNRGLLDGLFSELRPRAIVHLAAESHVDRSIHGPAAFLEDDTHVQYKTTDYYARELEGCILWNDSSIGIQWPLPDGSQPILSPKDAIAPSLARLMREA